MQARQYAASRLSTLGCVRREAPKSEEVKFIRGNDRINQLARRPDIAAELTQVELARRMGVTRAAIGRMEQPHDLLQST
jgi:hypothetical protein